jgi:hypothetical protein
LPAGCARGISGVASQHRLIVRMNVRRFIAHQIR